MQRQFMFVRAENRVEMKVTAMLIGRHPALGVEKAITENVSSRSVRVISTNDWVINDTILVALPGGYFTSAARVIYCDELAQGRFVAGLEFVGSSEPLEIGALAMTQESPNG
jgi:hypothetical protein